MPARRTSRPSSRRKVRLSMMVPTRPSPCGSKLQPAAIAERVVEAITTPQNKIAAQRRSLIVLVTDFMTLGFMTQPWPASCRSADADTWSPSLSENSIRLDGVTNFSEASDHSALRKTMFRKDGAFGWEASGGCGLPLPVGCGMIAAITTNVAHSARSQGGFGEENFLGAARVGDDCRRQCGDGSIKAFG